MDCSHFGTCLDCTTGKCMWGILDKGFRECRYEIVDFSKKVPEIVEDVLGCPVAVDAPASALIVGLGIGGAALVVVAAAGIAWALRKKSSKFQQLADEERVIQEAISLEPLVELPSEERKPEVEDQVLLMELRSGFLKPTGKPSKIRGKAERKKRQD